MALASLLCDLSEPQIIAHRESRLFYLFPHLHLLFSDSVSSLIFSLLLFSSLTLHTAAFPSVHIVGSLTSKLPSKIMVPPSETHFGCHQKLLFQIFSLAKSQKVNQRKLRRFRIVSAVGIGWKDCGIEEIHWYQGFSTDQIGIGS